MDKAENSAHGYTEGAETPEAKELRHYMLYNRIAVLPDGVEFLKAVNEGITELKSLRSELQKQKELNAELLKYEVSPRVAGLIIQVRDAIATKDYDEAYHILYQIASPGFNKTDPWGELESLIKKYKES